MNSRALVVPLRDFGTAKSRLSDVLTDTQRSRLAELCARGVFDRQVPCHRIAVCDTDSMEGWALDLGVDCVRVSVAGLNAALTAALPEIRRRHPASDLVIAHGDIIDPIGLDEILSPESFQGTDVVIVPDRHRDGTNVLRLAANVAGDWSFEYGPGSFERHCEGARAKGWRFALHENDGLATDLDTPDDVLEPRVLAFLATHFPEWSIPGMECT